MRRRLLAAIAAMAVSTAAPTASAQEYPTRPITFIVPFAAGGSLDALTRTIGEGLARELGQPVVMDFRPGQGGYVGAEALGRARPDGYTIGMIASTHAIGRAVYPKVAVDVTTLAPIGLFLQSPFVLVAHPGLEVRSLQDLVGAARSRTTPLNIASSGNGSSAHLLAEMLKRAASIDLVHVPYRAGSGATTDVMAGHVQLYFELASIAVQNAQAGKVRAIALTGPTRLPALPDVPTMRESGMPTVELVGWGGVSAPSGTPEPIVRRLGAALRTVVESNDVKERFVARSSSAVWTSGAAFGEYVKSESERLGAIVRDANIRPD